MNFRGSLDALVQLKLELKFISHYGEPNLEIVHNYRPKDDLQTVYLLEYNPHTGAWKTSKKPDSQVAIGDGTHDDVAREVDAARMMPTQDAAMPDNAKPTSVANILLEVIEISDQEPETHEFSSRC